MVSAHLKDTKLSTRLTFRAEECAPLCGEFETKRYLSLLESVDKDMPVIVEHLTTDEEYLQALDRLKAIL